MTRTETTAARQGWAASFAIHAAVIALLFFVHLRTRDPLPEFVDMSWGNSGGSSGNGAAAGNGAGAMNVSPQALEASAQKAAQKTEEDNVALPSRRPSMFPEEAINLPSSKKTVNPDALPNFSPSNKISGDERKSSPSSSTFSSRGDVKVGASGRTGAGGSGTNPYGTGSGNGTGNGIGDGSGDGVSYGIEWGGHGTRRLETGGLPTFPSGVNREAQIKLKLVVMPSGSVKSAQPLQKGDTRLENAALKAVRLWKFDALQSAQAAVDQACTVTFNFKLK